MSLHKNNRDDLLITRISLASYQLLLQSVIVNNIPLVQSLANKSFPLQCNFPFFANEMTERCVNVHVKQHFLHHD